MLDRYWLAKLDREALNDLWQFKLYDLDLTKRRTAKLEAKKKANPEFKAYDKWADDFVDIDSRLEEQSCVREMIFDDIDDIDSRIKVIDRLEYLEELKEEYPDAKIVKCDIIGKPVLQLSLFERVMA